MFSFSAYYFAKIALQAAFLTEWKMGGTIFDIQQKKMPSLLISLPVPTVNVFFPPEAAFNRKEITFHYNKL